MISFLSERSPRLLRLARSWNIRRLRTLFAVNWGRFWGARTIGSVMSDEFPSQVRRSNARNGARSNLRIRKCSRHRPQRDQWANQQSDMRTYQPVRLTRGASESSANCDIIGQPLTNERPLLTELQKLHLSDRACIQLLKRSILYTWSTLSKPEVVSFGSRPTRKH